MEKDLKDLLLRDLCARLSYGVKVQYYDYESERVEIDVVEGCENMGTKHPYFYVGQYSLTLDKLKPVLYPLSSMTHEQFEGLKVLCNMYDNYNDYNPHEYWGIQVCRKHIHGNKTCFANNYKVIYWLNEHHFDYNGLIEKGLAIDATNLNVY